MVDDTTGHQSSISDLVFLIVLCITIHYYDQSQTNSTIKKKMKGLSYYIQGKLYISLTNKCNSASVLACRGPSFPFAKTFALLPSSFEPKPLEIFAEVDNAFLDGKISVSSMESDEVTFAGYGEPLLRLEALLESCSLIKEKYHGVPLRLKTNGLISGSCSEVAQRLMSAGIDQVSISLNADNPKLYSEIMQPSDGLSFANVCNFVAACSEAGNYILMLN